MGLWSVIPVAVINRGVERLLALAPRAVWMAIPCILVFQVLWRLWPAGNPWSIPTYGGGGLLILGAMRLLRYRVPDAAFTLVLGLTLLSIFCVLQGDLTLARVMCGGVLVVLFMCAAGAIFDEPMDRALAWGQAVTILAWFAGNVARGTFGLEVARSALGQAYGPWAEPLLLALILAGYPFAWYNPKAKKV